MTDLYFVTSNDYKFGEYERLFRDRSVTLSRKSIGIQEIQTVDFDPIVRHKILSAYQSVTRPVMIDVSGMMLTALSGLPGGLNKQFWHVLKDTVCDLAAKLGSDSAQIVSCLSVCDGFNIHSVEHIQTGRIAPAPTKGNFHLDRVFIPDGHVKTLAEMSESERDKIGYRAMAADKMVALLKSIRLGQQMGIP